MNNSIKVAIVIGILFGSVGSVAGYYYAKYTDTQDQVCLLIKDSIQMARIGAFQESFNSTVTLTHFWGNLTQAYQQLSVSEGC